MLLKHLCIKKTESKRVIVGTLNTKTNSCMTLVPTEKARPKIRPKNVFFCYVPFLGLIFWVTFCSNSNTLTFDSKVYIWNKSLVKKLL